LPHISTPRGPAGSGLVSTRNFAPHDRRRQLNRHTAKDTEGRPNAHGFGSVGLAGHMTSTNYVETVRRVAVINTPYVFKALFGTLRFGRGVMVTLRYLVVTLRRA